MSEALAPIVDRAELAREPGAGDPRSALPSWR